MDRCFNLTLSQSLFASYIQSGRAAHEQNKQSVRKTLDSFKNLHGDVLAKKLVASWFPKVKADVFLSHSHKDNDLVLAFAGWLKTEHGLDVFVDSCAWGYSEELVDILANEFAKNMRSDHYNYTDLKRVCTHVDMMLSTALAHMIDQCPCIIFVNTPNSISIKDSLSGQITMSPWIYSEISMTKLLPQKKISLEEAAILDSVTKRASILYEVELSHLTPLKGEDLTRWHASKPGRGRQALQRLFDQHRPT